jgi:hypothetical protein
MTARLYVAQVRLRGRGPLRRLYLTRRGGFTVRRAFAQRGVFTLEQVAEAQEWAKAKGHRVRAVALDPYPFLTLDADTRAAKPDLMRRIDKLGRALGHELLIREGWRTREQQEAFWDAFVARGYRPPLVARPGTSLHETGDAADVGTLRGGVNIGNVPGAREAMRRLGLCLPVPGEPWHVEVGDRWSA